MVSETEDIHNEKKDKVSETEETVGEKLTLKIEIEDIQIDISTVKGAVRESGQDH